LEDAHGQGGAEQRGERLPPSRRAEPRGNQGDDEQATHGGEPLRQVGEPVAAGEELQVQGHILRSRGQVELALDARRVEVQTAVLLPVHHPCQVVGHRVPRVRRRSQCDECGDGHRHRTARDAHPDDRIHPPDAWEQVAGPRPMSNSDGSGEHDGRATPEGGDSWARQRVEEAERLGRGGHEDAPRQRGAE
jgi:hypothetical protein